MSINFKSSITYFWLLVVMLLIYDYIMPMSAKALEIAYSCAYFWHDNPKESKRSILGYSRVGLLKEGSDDDKRKPNISTFESIPQNLIECLLATEDRTFFDPIRNFMGVNWRGLVRAVINGGSKGGGSGLTQQVAKNLFLKDFPPQNLNRKVTEAIVSSNLDRTFPREELLLLYLNNVPFTNTIYGFKAASKYYFGKNLEKLSLDQMATLVGFLKAPSTYGRDNAKAQARRNTVLKNLVEVGQLSALDYKVLSEKSVHLLNLDSTQSNRNRFLEYEVDNYESLIKYAQKEVIKILNQNGLDTTLSGLRIYTSFNPIIQTAAEETIKATWERFPDEMQESQIGAVSVEIGTGRIMAFVGKNPQSTVYGLNHATEIKRQVGSTFKVFAYGALLNKPKWNLQSTLPDKPLAGDWQPRNFGGSYSSADVPIEDCLAKSLNLPTASIIKLNYCSIKEIKAFAKACGVNATLPNDGSIVLGTASVSPLEMAVAYSTVVNQGNYIKPISILKIKNNKNEIIFESKPTYQKAMHPATATMLKTALKKVVENGTASVVKKDYSGASLGKTGTTNSFTDAWFVGCTPHISTAIWIGFDNPSTHLPEQFGTGSRVAAPIWARMMKNLQNKKHWSTQGKF